MVVAQSWAYRYGCVDPDHSVWLAYGRSGAVARYSVRRDVHFRRQAKTLYHNSTGTRDFRTAELADAVARGFANSAAIGNLFLEQPVVVRVVLVWATSPVRQL